MAKGDNEERQMLFDLRGRRRNVVKVVYAVLAILMAASLLLVVGPFSVAEIFSDRDAAQADAAKPYEERAERLERDLAKSPGDAEKLAALVRARTNAGNQLVESDPNTGQFSVSVEARQQYELAADAWTSYLDASEEPNGALAESAVRTLVTLAETSPRGDEGLSNITAAAEAQQIVTQIRPSLNAWFTLALYSLFAGDTEVAEEAKREAEKLAASKIQRQQIDNQYQQTEKRAEEFTKQQVQAEKLEQEFDQATGGNQNPLQGGVLSGE